MLAEKKRNTNIGIGAGIGLQLVGRTLIADGNMIGGVLVLVGAIAFIWGCCSYAQGKGYHGAVGLLGLLSCLGLVILAVLPDKHKGTPETPTDT